MRLLKRLLNRRKDYFDIEMNLDADFVKTLKYLKKKYNKELISVNGFSNENLNFTSFIDNFIDSNNVANATIDPNANTGSKDVKSLMTEMDKPHSKLLSFNKLFYEMKKEFGLKEAKRWLEQEWTGGLYMHDAPSSSFYSYCYAYELAPLVEKGLFFLPQTNVEPAKHLNTFANHLRELVIWTSNRTSGACALPSFFIYSYYFWRHDVKTAYPLAVTNPDYYRRQFFQQFIFEMNQVHTRITQSAFTNIIVMDRNYITEIFGDRKYPDGTYVIDFVDEIIEHEKIFMEVVAETRHSVMHTFPVLSYALLFQNGKFVDEEFARWCSDHNCEWFDSNFYIGDSVTNLASCCRMLNDITKIPKQFQSSIGGSLTEIGSIKVSTINLMRIAIESKGNKEKFIEILRDRVELNMLILDRVRHTIKRNIEKGLLPNYSNGIIKLENQVVTNGLTAMFEAIEEMGLTQYDDLGNVYYTDEGLEFASLILDTVNQMQDERMEKVGYRISLEIIPAESANVKLCKKDNIMYKRDKHFIYSNQWISLMSKCTLDEKIRLASILDKKASGGQILHVSIQGKFPNQDMAWDMLNKIANSGVIYFAFNPKISVCEHNHGFFGEVCPTCGGPKTDEVSRIVGYLVPTSNYSSARYKEYYNRYQYTFDDNII